VVVARWECNEFRGMPSPEELPMSLPLLPVGKVVHVCDDVVADPISHKPSILNLWEVVRLPQGATFPYTLGKLCVAARMSDGQGEIRFRVDVLRADTTEVIRQSRDYSVRFANRHRSTLVVVRLRDVTFPAPGTYLVQLFAEGAFIDDQSISVLPA
jgi:hypothetical protein